MQEISQNRSLDQTAQSNLLKVVSYLSPNLFWFYKAISAYLARALNLGVEIEQSPFDPLEDPHLHQDQWDFAFICGLPFARLRAIAPNPLMAIVAPVMQADRYQNRPVYFADVIVAADRDRLTLNDLAGKTFCYNDRGSNSGYNLLRQRFMQGGYPPGFFGQTLPSGSHQQSMQWVAAGRADCATIDSVVLEQEFRDFPDLAKRLRVIESLGACPMPPIAVSQRLGTAMIEQLQTLLLQPDAELQAAMAQAHIRRFAPVQSEDYDSLATQYEAAIQAGYESI